MLILYMIQKGLEKYFNVFYYKRLFLLILSYAIFAFKR